MYIFYYNASVEVWDYSFVEIILDNILGITPFTILFDNLNSCKRKSFEYIILFLIF